MTKEEKRLNIPTTNFPMKSGLISLEPRIQEFWVSNNIRSKIKSQRKGQKKFDLHFGPPYANGSLHSGHGLNILLKDLIVRSHSLLGYDINNITGHDCHGLPIEIATKKHLNKIKKTPVDLQDFLKECDSFSQKYIEQQQQAMSRMGILKENEYYTTKNSVVDIYKVFEKLVFKDLVYMAKKPCPWSITEETVISDAEIIYKTKESSSIDVALKIVKSPFENLKNKYVIIWTTTPWTLIDNQAVCFNENHFYNICEMNNNIYFVASEALNSFKDRTGKNIKVLAKVKGDVFKNSFVEHPLLDMAVPLISGDHVEASSGTGFVHTAPAHGIEDFEICEKHNIPVRESVDSKGFYLQDTPFLGGKHIFQNEFIFEKLRNKLINTSVISHEYPYDSRSIQKNDKGQITHTPLIYRATEQIFIDINKIDMEELEKDLSSLETKPEFLKTSLLETIKKRKEWCVSRNRTLGVPTAIFVHKQTGEILKDSLLQKKIYTQFQKDPSYFLSNKAIEILQDIVENIHDYEIKKFVLDVWFDSGCVSYLLSPEDKYAVGDVYIEGKDQVRGWFQSSLLNGYLSEKTIPYKKIISHGFVVDEQGYKMSKSKGNTMDLQETIDSYGVEILRLWVARSDYTGDVAIGKEILGKNQEVYRKIRNVIRYLISVTENQKENPEFQNFEFIECAILNELNQVTNEFKENIKRFNLRKAFNSIYDFILRISEVYFNAVKDILYCNKDNDSLRQSTVQCFFIILRTLLLLNSFLLPFTTEEMYQYCEYLHEQWGNKTSIHELSFDNLRIPVFDSTYSILSLDEDLKDIRKTIEDLKQDGKCSKNSDLIVYTKLKFDQPLDVVRDILRVVKVEQSSQEKIIVSSEENCARCGKRLGSLCQRCKDVLSET